MRRGQKTNAEQVVLKLRQIEAQTAQGKNSAFVCRVAEISQQSYYRWRKEYGGLQVDRAKKMKDLERENARLKVARCINSVGVIEALTDAMCLHGIPDHIRRDDGPEIISKAQRKWVAKAGPQVQYIAP